MTVGAPIATCVAETFQGLPCHRLTLPNGDTVLVAEHGAQVLSWQANGREQLYLSPRSRWDGASAIRGGVPVCWPQFNERGGLTKHGFARLMPWAVQAPALSAACASLSLQLRSGPATEVHWPQAFRLTLKLLLAPGSLRIELTAGNTGDTTWSFSGALHTYLALDDIAHAALHGLTGRPQWDALTGQYTTVSSALRFGGEFDRVYSGSALPMRLQNGTHALRISQSPTWGNTVVWNPGAARCAQLADMPPDGYRHMLCVEAAQVFDPVPVLPGAQWQGWQQFDLA